MKTDEVPYGEIAIEALCRAGGNPWRAYELAKREVTAMLTDEPQQALDNAARRIAEALRI